MILTSSLSDRLPKATGKVVGLAADLHACDKRSLSRAVYVVLCSKLDCRHMSVILVQSCIVHLLALMYHQVMWNAAHHSIRAVNLATPADYVGQGKTLGTPVLLSPSLSLLRLRRPEHSY